LGGIIWTLMVKVAKIELLVKAMYEDKAAIVVTSDPYRRGEIARLYEVTYIHHKFRMKRWFGRVHFGVLDRILTKEEYDALAEPPDQVYFDGEVL